MSTTQEQTIQQIASSATSRQEFLDGFVQHLIEDHGVIGGMFWDCSRTPFSALNQQYHPRFDRLQLSFSAAQHEQFLTQARDAKEPLLISAEVPPQPVGSTASATPPQQLHPSILFISLKQAGKSEVAELFFAGDQTRDSLTRKVAELNQLCHAAACLPAAGESPIEQAPLLEPNQPTTETLDAFVHSLHQSLDLTDNAKVIANETRRFLDCDRVSVLKMKGKRGEVIAISGQPSVNRRSNTVRLLRKVAEKVLPTRQLFWQPTEEAIPPQIKGPLETYLSQSATRTFIAVPIISKPTSHQLRVDEHRETDRLIGGIIIEHCREQWDRDQMALTIDIAARHGSDSFRNAFDHHSLFLYSLWKWIGKSRVLFAARNLSKTLAAFAAALLACLALIFVPADFQMSCNGTLIPQQRQMIYPHSAGVVTEVAVDHGDAVRIGDTIVQMVDLDLDYKLTEIEGRVEELEQTIRSTRSGRLDRDRKEEGSLQQESLRAQQAELTSLRNQQQVLQKRKENLTVKSPLSGRVMTWDVREKLESRPVNMTDQLMEIANIEGKWTLELDLPDRKVGHFLHSWRRAEENDQPVKVEFILAADPGTTHVGHVAKVGKATELNAANEHHLKILVDIDIQGIDVRQSRSGVSAKIDCGEESLGYVWFHPVAEFFQAKVLFPLW